MTRATVFLFLFASALFAQEPSPAPDASAAPGAPAKFEAPLPAPETEQMRKWEGQWKTVATFAKGGMMPNGGEAKGSYASVRGLNGHAFVGDYKATGTGGDFVGHGVRMFDPLTKKWKSWWYDSWVPGHADLSVGEVAPDGTFTTESDSEYQGNKFKMRIVERWTDDNKVEQAFESDLGQGWTPVMTIAYTRKGKWKEKPVPGAKKSRRGKNRKDEDSDGDKPKDDEKGKSAKGDAKADKPTDDKAAKDDASKKPKKGSDDDDDR